MANLKDVVQALKRVDWNFPGSGTDVGSIHSLHSFPGNFIPQIPSFFVQALSKPGDLVLDPFGGSGTTAVEAIRLGRNAISADSVTACVFLASSKLAVISGALTSQLRAEVSARLAWDGLSTTDRVGFRGEGENKELEGWFGPSTLGQLRYIWQVIESYDGNVRSVLELLFADTLFACASTGSQLTRSGKVRRHHWGWIADNVKPRKLQDNDAISAFQDRLFQSSLNWEKRPKEGRATILKQSATAMAIEDSSIDLIVTSPPYIGVIDYTKANRLLYLWMGWPFDEDRENEIGARYRRMRNNFDQEYLKCMDSVWNEFKRVLKRGAYCAVVLGESRKFPGVSTTAFKSLNLAIPIVWGPVRRIPTRRRVADRLNRESFEYLIVCQK